MSAASAAGSGPAQAQDLVASLPYFDSTMLGVGDATGDGAEDFLVGHLDTSQVDLISGATMRSVHTWNGPPQGGDGFGRTLARGDVTGDGVAEYLIGSTNHPVVVGGSVQQNVGRVLVVDAATRQVLLEIDGEQAFENFGTAICAADLDNDGRDELLIGAPGYDDPSGSDWGRVATYKIEGPTQFLTARKLRQWNGTASEHNFGRSIAVGDFSGNAALDVLVGAVGQLRSCSTPFNSYAVVYEGGLFGGLYFMHPPIQPSVSYRAWSVAALPDLDRDGKQEFAVGSLFEHTVYVYSGATRTLSYAVPSSQNWRFGEAMAVVPDQDGDGIDDLLIGGGDPNCSNSSPGHAEVVSLGRNGRLIDSFVGYRLSSFWGRGFGKSVSFADVDGDGQIEFLIGGYGATHVRTRIDRTMWAEQSSLSRSAGGSVPFRISVGPQYAGHYYVVFGTLSGFSPGITLGPVHIPLNPDGFTLANGAAMNAVPFINFFGVLDAQGQGTASWTAMPQTPAVFDTLPMHYAAVIVQQNPLLIVSATNPVAFNVRP
jgi:hypothetical protein